MPQYLVAIHHPDGYDGSLERGLADEVLLVVYPVLLGTGKRFFAEGTPPRSFELVSTKAVASGVILSTYKPNGPLRTGTVGV